MKFKIPKLPIFYQFIIFISFIEVLSFFFLRIMGLGIFKLVPYLRLISISFFLLYLYKKRLINYSFLRISLSKQLENKLMVFWIFFSVLAFIIGFLFRNPLLYLFTDLFYIIIGFFLFRIFQINFDNIKNDFNYELTKAENNYFLIVISLISFFAIIVKADLPSFLLIFSISYSLYLLITKKYLLSLLFLIPFFVQISTSNRSILIVFIIALLIAMVRGRITKTNIISFTIFAFICVCFLFYYLEDLLKYTIDNLLQTGHLKQRLNQVYLIVSGKLDWNSPMALSLKQRLVEAELVIEYWTSSPLHFIFGGGLGATIDGFSFKDSGVTNSSILGKEAVHNIHLLPFSLILRYGLFGVVIFFFLLRLIMKYLNILIFKDISFKFPMYVFTLCWIVYSVPAASFLWTSTLFWIMLAQVSKDEKYR